MWSLVSNRAVLIVIACGVLTASIPHGAATSPENEIATGHIQAGVPHGYLWLEGAYTILWGTSKAPVYDTPFGFVVDIQTHRDQWIEGQVSDNTGAGYFVDMVFYDEQERRIFELECPGSGDNQGISNGQPGLHEIQPRCKVPANATWLVVTAHTGINLDVRIVQTAA